MYCPVCKMGIHRSDSKFCWSCGGELDLTAPTCSCGQTLSRLDRFCPGCGKITTTAVERTAATSSKEATTQ